MNTEKEFSYLTHYIYIAKMLGACPIDVVKQVEDAVMRHEGKNIWEEMRILNGFETTEDEESFFQTFKHSTKKQRQTMLTQMRKAKVDSEIIRILTEMINIPN